MKLNIWQWLGVALLALGLILYVTKKAHAPAPSTPSSPAATPATAPR
jgi:hypothetical protein